MRVLIYRSAHIGLTETFIRNFATRLPCEMILLEGSPLAVNGTKQPADSLPRRLFDKIGRSITGKGQDPRRRLLASLRPDVIFAQYGPGGVDVLPHAQALSIPMVVHFHGFDGSNHEVLVKHSTAYRKLFAYASAVVVPCIPMGARLANLGCPERKIVVNGYGVDLSLFSPDASQRNFFTLLAVGRFVDKKAPYLTLAAFHQALVDFPHARLRMIGDGPLMDVCVNLVRAWRITESVDFLGATNHAVVKEEMARAGIFIQHSLTPSSGDQEGTPVSILEASACALPVVATRHAGIPEAVEDGVTGFLVDEGDVQSMAARIKEMLKNPQLAQSMGARGREKISREFDQESRLAIITDILTQAAKSR